MKRISIIVAAMALVLGLSQCKKEQTTTANEDETVTITLDIQHNGGTRMGVNTSTGEVTYETVVFLFLGQRDTCRDPYGRHHNDLLGSHQRPNGAFACDRMWPVQ